MYIPAPKINFYNNPSFVPPKLFTEFVRIKRKPPKTPAEDETPGLLCFGSIGEVPGAQQVPMVDVNVITHKEKSRTTTPVRIENPDDPAQHVDALQTNGMDIVVDSPADLDNSATMDAVAANIEGAIEHLKKHAENIKTGNYKIVYNPPERAL